jgi:uncharacterized coiled-coil protein SlyX
MPSRLRTAIQYSEDEHYMFFDTRTNEVISKNFKPNSAKYFNWLSKLKSFHFEGKEGQFTARLEARKNKGETTCRYWSAYRKANKHQFRKYLGTTEKLTIAKLEETAKHFQDVCNPQEPKIKTPRKKIIPRASLLAEIEARNKAISTYQKTIQTQEETIQELSTQILEQRRIIERQKARIHQLERLI